MRPERLILVYNTDNGIFNALTDWAHKFFSPATYVCTLCHYTYSTRGMLFPWKAFLESLQIANWVLSGARFGSVGVNCGPHIDEPSNPSLPLTRGENSAPPPEPDHGLPDNR
jgi:hypothetical protein